VDDGTGEIDNDTWRGVGDVRMRSIDHVLDVCFACVPVSVGFFAVR
jgi:hypothetical protein